MMLSTKHRHMQFHPYSMLVNKPLNEQLIETYKEKLYDAPRWRRPKVVVALLPPQEMIVDPRTGHKLRCRVVKGSNTVVAITQLYENQGYYYPRTKIPPRWFRVSVLAHYIIGQVFFSATYVCRIMATVLIQTCHSACVNTWVRTLTSRTTAGGSRTRTTACAVRIHRQATLTSAQADLFILAAKLLPGHRRNRAKDRSARDCNCETP